MTATIQIGNSDDKLSQREWSNFVEEVRRHIAKFADAVHFHACSPGDTPWQNACWVAEVGVTRLGELRASLTAIRETFRQQSVAITCGHTEFI